MISVENVNREFPRYPMTVEDKGWIYGVWYCNTFRRASKLYGQYPRSFLPRALALFPGAKDILHCPSGTLTGPGLCVDAIRDDARQPHVIADAKALPLPDNAFDLVLSDPPYTPKDSAIYGCKPFPLLRFVKEAHRVLRPGGFFGILHLWQPNHNRKMWMPRALIAVVTGPMKRTRMFSVLQKQDVETIGDAEQRTLFSEVRT